MNKTFADSPFEFHHDSQGRLISIPSVAELEGYLALDKKKGHFVQVRLARGASEEKRRVLEDLWRDMEREPGVSPIAPEVLYTGEEKGIPFYVSSLPAGEPLSSYIRRNGAIPVECAAVLVKHWVFSLLEGKPFDFSQYAVPPESVWIARGLDWQPRIMLGDLLPIRHPAAGMVNAQLCLDILKFLTGNPPYDEDFQQLCEALQAGPSNLETVQRLLESYLEPRRPDSAYWSDVNQPSPFLDQVVPPEVIIQTGLAEEHFGPESFFSADCGEERAPANPAKADPSGKTANSQRVGLLRLAGLALTAVLILAGLRFFYKGEDLPAIFSKAPESPRAMEAPAEAKMAEVGAPVLKAAAKPMATFSRDDSPVAYEPESIEIIAPPEPLAAKSAERSAFRELAEQARQKQDLVAAIGYGLGELTENPASAEAKNSLGVDLRTLANCDGLRLSPAETAVIEKAVKVNPAALEVLVRHYRNQSQWDKEIAALLELAQTGRPDKLSEAGRRLFDKPDSQPADLEKARAYFEDAAKLGDLDGQFFAGECFILGRGGEKDYVKGCHYLRQASDRGDVRAMDLLGVCHVRGWGVPRDDARAVTLFQRAVEGNYVPSYYNLGARYAQGQGVARDPVKAADSFEKGSLKGNLNCMLVLGRCFEAGFGREADFGKATFWFSKAAAGGNSEAVEWCQKNLIDYTKHLTAGN